MNFMGLTKFGQSFFMAGTILLCLLFSACVPSAGSNNARKSSSTSEISTGSGSSASAAAPTFTNSANFFQNGTTLSQTSFQIDLTFSDSFYFRGNEVHGYLNSGNQNVACLVFNFPDIGGASKTLVLAGNPKSFYNFKTISKEFYYLIEPANKTLNSNFCQSAGTLNYVGLNFPSSTVAFALGDICISCNNFLLDSSPLELITLGGQLIKNIQTAYLDLRVKTQGTAVANPTGVGCIATSECLSKGFDCCNGGQCVDDKTLKSGVDTTLADFQMALSDIEANPSTIYNYPNFYNICAQNVTVTPTPSVTLNPDTAANLRLTMLKELYECSSLVLGEMSICTSTYREVAKNPVDFFTGADDRNFNTTYSGTKVIQKHSIHEIIHADSVLFSNGSGVAGTHTITPTNGNDTLTDKVQINLTHTKPASATNDDLKIRYTIDGSCNFINSTLAKCQKYYVQGQNLAKLNDHFPASNKFFLPLYADVSRSLKVEVDGTAKFVGTHWNLVEGSPSYIQFFGESGSTALQVFDTQKLSIEFFVNLSSNNVMQSKLTALNSIDAMCNCGGPFCSLKEVFINVNGTDRVSDYTCVYPVPAESEPPMQQTLFMSAKTVPHRFFDKTGVHQTNINLDTPEQEGTKFEYLSGNLLRPNNLTQVVGFNEIYGSFTADVTSAKPAKEVKVKNGKTYDIFIDYGSFSTCLNCGNDYWASLTKIFPANFTQKGAGYRPEKNQTDRTKVTSFRTDDLLYGRACFVPATMIPWTHGQNPDRNTQRRNRLAAQHFLFANGYQRDWFGFDYGAVIASFDGVSWFAVGNQRRIKAISNRLYIAVNGYFGDLTLDSNFTITISEANLTLGSGSQITVDDASDGAECRKYHQCEKDNDCVSQLGWEYTCENVGLIKTIWPVFDSNAQEIPDQPSTGTSKSLTGVLAGETAGKRCVYRGRGAPCHPNYSTVNSTSSYNSAPGATEPGLHSCAPNFYCQAFLSGTDQALFNNRITRFGKSPQAQNLSVDTEETEMDTFGLAARFIGRPYHYNGKEVVFSSGARSNMSRNNIVALCIPGKNVGTDALTFLLQNPKKPDPTGLEKYDGDLVLNIGMTKAGQGGTSADDHYLSACGIMDDFGNYIYKTTNAISSSLNLTSTMGSTAVKRQAYSQATSTNALDTFNRPEFSSTVLTKIFGSEFVEEFSYQPNRCLRMPGSVCFSDQDCAANKTLSDLLSEANPEQEIFDGETSLNSFEVRFWQQELICGQEVAKTNATYDLKKNRCCRNMGKEFKIAQKSVGLNGAIDYTASLPNVETGVGTIAPVQGQAFNNLARNSQISLYVKEVGSGGSGGPYTQLQIPVANACGANETNCPILNPTFLNQFNTIQALGRKMCCTGHWVRNFNDENGGGHKWDDTKGQALAVDTLKCLNWKPCNNHPTIEELDECGGDGIGGEDTFTCSHVNEPFDSRCLIQNITDSEQKRIFDYLGRFELLGIPQVPILSRNSATGSGGASDNTLTCRVDPARQTVSGNNISASISDNFIIPGLYDGPFSARDMKGTNAAGGSTTDSEFHLGQYYSAGDLTNFKSTEGVKLVFSPDTLACCKPAGTIMDIGEDSQNCCTGFVNAAERRCSLPDYTDVTVYTNKFVSSALKDLELAGSLSDKNREIYNETGYILEPNVLINAACTLKICDSQVMALGVGWGSYTIPPFLPDGNNGGKVNRFVQMEEEIGGLGLYFKAGLRYNSHVYCVPDEIMGQANDARGAGMIIHNCNQ